MYFYVGGLSCRRIVVARRIVGIRSTPTSIFRSQVWSLYTKFTVFSVISKKFPLIYGFERLNFRLLPYFFLTILGLFSLAVNLSFWLLGLG